MQSPLNPMRPRTANKLPSIPARRLSGEEVTWADLSNRPIQIGILSAKGGSGKTSTSLNLAAHIATLQQEKELEQKTLYIFADQDDYPPMKIPENNQNIDHLFEAIEAGNINSFEDLKEHLIIRTDLENMFVLLAPEAWEIYSPQEIKKLNNILKTYFAAIIVDIGHASNPSAQTWFKLVDSLYLTSVLEETSLLANKKLMTSPILQSLPQERKGFILLEQPEYASKVFFQKIMQIPRLASYYIGYHNHEIVKANQKAEFFALKKEGATYRQALEKLRIDAFNLGYR